MTELGFFSDVHLQAFAKSLVDKVTAFVETGKEEGKTTEWAARYFSQVFTCEIDAKYLTRNYWEMLPKNVLLYAMNSPQFISEIELLAGDMPLFFLDAHWGDYWPLQDELKTIEVRYKQAVIIVHDCHVPGRPNFWTCRGGGADHAGPVLDWAYIKQAIDPAHYRLFYPTYGDETPGYCVLFKDCEPMGNLKDLEQCPI